VAKRYNLFISHSWSYSDQFERLLALLSKDPYFSYKDYSVAKDEPLVSRTDSELRAAIKRQMTPCHVVLVMAGVYSTHSKWIRKEIQIAKNEFAVPKPIIGVRYWASARVSSVVSDAANIMVGWNKSSIVSAIRDLAK